MLFAKAVEIIDVLRKRGSTLISPSGQTFQWVLVNRKKALSMIGASILLVGACGLWINRSLSSPKDFYLSEQIYRKWLNSPLEEGYTAAKQLKKYLTSIPDLQSAYAASMVQSSMISPRADEKLPPSWARNILQRAHSTPSYYQRFSQHALWIAEGKYGEALTAARTLKEDLKKDEAFWRSQGQLVRYGSILYGMNLLRIASLEQELGMREEEKRSLQEVEEFLHMQTAPSTAYRDPESTSLLTQSLRDGNVTIFDYIDSRKK